MTALFDVQVSVGNTITNNRVVTKALGRRRFENPQVFVGEDASKDGYYFCPAKMVGHQRGNRFIECLPILVFDIDGLSADDMQVIHECLDECPYENIRYTTLNHTPKKQRWRIILNPSRPLTLVEYKCSINQLAKQLGINTYDDCSETANPMFYPMVYEDRLGTEQFIYQKGEKVNVKPLLKAMINADTDEGYKNEDNAYLPMPIPGSTSEEFWLATVCDEYKAKDCDHWDEWNTMGMALWHQTDGRVAQLWLDWSRANEGRHGKKDGIAKCEHDMMTVKWPSFDHRKKKRKREEIKTLRSVLNLHDTNGKKILAKCYARLLHALTTPEQIKRVVTDIQDDEFVNERDLKVIAPALKQVYKKVNDTFLSIGESIQILSRENRDDARKEYFLNNYVFSIGETQYYDISYKEPIPIGSMNYHYADEMPVNNNGQRKMVHKVLSDGAAGFVKPRSIYGSTYNVGGDAIINENGRDYLNMFQPHSWPHSEGNWDTSQEVDATIKDYMHRHLKLLCNDDTTLVRMLIQHLGHLRQRPMQRLHFAYAISSTLQGAGKSTLRRLYEIVLGKAQVNLLSASNVAEDYNAYASAPHLMSFIEEFEFNNRRDQNKAIKKMKDMITSDTISVRKMRTDARQVPTYTAYAIFSNDEYVLGHESTGRRWVPIYVNASTEEQASEALQEDHEKFYNEYHTLMDKYPDRFVAYFDQVSLEGFNVERPPHNARKQQFIENVPQARCLRIIRELIEDKVSTDLTADYACEGAVFKLVRNHIELRIDDNADASELEHFNNQGLRNLISKALRTGGYSQCGLSTDRLRMPFQEVHRTRMCEVWVRDTKKYAGSEGVKRLRFRIQNDIDRRQKTMTKSSATVTNLQDRRETTEEELEKL